MSWLQSEIAGISDWLAAHGSASAWLLGASVAASIGGLLVVRRLVLVIPHDYFSTPPKRGFRARHPIIRYTLLVAKNILGAVLLVLGLFMLVAPGPGIVTLLLALVFLDVPGKRVLEKRIIALPTVLHVINGMRRRANRPAVEAPTHD